MPVISANPQARPEGCFRLERKLAVDHSHLMADDAPFLFPVVIDDMPDAMALARHMEFVLYFRRAYFKEGDEAVRIEAALGRVDEALPELQRQLSLDHADIGWPLTPALLRLHPLWGKLRGDARIQKLIADTEAGGPPAASAPP